MMFVENLFKLLFFKTFVKKLKKSDVLNKKINFQNFKMMNTLYQKKKKVMNTQFLGFFFQFKGTCCDYIIKKNQNLRIIEHIRI